MGRWAVEISLFWVHFLKACVIAFKIYWDTLNLKFKTCRDRRRGVVTPPTTPTMPPWLFFCHWLNWHCRFYLFSSLSSPPFLSGPCLCLRIVGQTIFETRRARQILLPASTPLLLLTPLNWVCCMRFAQKNVFTPTQSLIGATSLSLSCFR